MLGRICPVPCPTMEFPVFKTGFLAAAIMLASGCMLGPDYVRPEQVLPADVAASDGWKVAEPAQADSSSWWQLYEDEELARLLAALEQGNQNLAAAEAAWREASAALGGSRSALYPQLGFQAGDTRWQLDLWGEVRRQVEAGQARLEASAADWAALRLSQQSLLVQNYIQLRSLDEQLRIAA